MFGSSSKSAEKSARVQYVSHMVAERAFEHSAEPAEAQRQAARVEVERTAELDRQQRFWRVKQQGRCE